MKHLFLIVLAMVSACVITETSDAQTNRRRPTTPSPASTQDKSRVRGRKFSNIILLMYAAYDFAGNETTMRVHRPDLKTRSDVLSDLRAEWINMLLFASKATLDSLRIFISDPTARNLVTCAAAMRVDLGREVLEIEKLDFNLVSATPEKQR